MKAIRFSIKLRVIIAVLIVLALITSAYSLLSVRTTMKVSDQFAEARKSTLDIYCTTLHVEVQKVESFMVLLAASNTGFQSLGSPGADAGPADNVGALMEETGALLNAQKNLSAMAVYSGANNVYYEQYSSSISYSGGETHQLRSTLVGYIEDGRVPDGWFLLHSDTRAYLTRAVRSGGAWAFGLFELSRLANSAKTDYLMDGIIVFSKNNEPINNANWLRQNGIELQNGGEYYMAGGNNAYMVVQRPFVGMIVSYIVPYRDSVGTISWINTAPVIFFLTVALAAVGVMLYFQYSFFRPLNDLVDTMERIGEGDLRARPGNYRSPEFAQVNETFNRMIGEITDLKIERYEKQLEVERAQMDALRMQIRPHYYLNNLKSIYGFAQTGKNDAIQQTILLLSNHLRYTFDLTENVVTLEKELQMCKNYVDLLAVGQAQKPECTIEVDAGLLEIGVPPISLLTVVENCAKHGEVPGRILRIDISVCKLPSDTDPLVDIKIRDNGPGFEPAMLARLNLGVTDAMRGSNVGLVNVVKRFHLIYGERFQMTFANQNGALTEIIVPLEKEAKA